MTGDVTVWAALSAALLQGLAGQLHCVGMCGPLVHALNSQREKPVAANLAYNLGRSLSYMSVGLLLGLFGATINQWVFSHTAAILGGVLVAYFGFAYLFPGKLPHLAHLRLPKPVQKALGSLVRGDEGGGVVERSALMGLASGMLPCGLLLPAYGLALGLGDPLAGAFVMFAFSLGTYPALFAFGLTSSAVWQRIQRGWLRYAMGALMIAFGAFMIYQRVWHPHRHDHHTGGEAREVESRSVPNREATAPNALRDSG